MDRRSAIVLRDGEPRVWLGANFWSRRGGPRMWRDYDGATVSEELAVLGDHGLTATRSFVYWPDFHPAPDVIDEAMVARFRDFLDRHAALGMTTIVTFIVGHMSGENWDPAWRGARDLYSDVWLVGRQAWFAGELVKRLIDHRAIDGYLLSNEMPIYGRPPGDPRPAAPTAEVGTWVQLMVAAVRAAGGTAPLGTGDGAWGVEMTGVDNGFSVREIAPMVDFIGPHVYRMESDQLRQYCSAAFACELATVAGLPVVLEEFGVSTAFCSDEGAGHYYRQVLHRSLLAGATGWLAWNNTDFDSLADEPPYSHHPFEMYFGITDNAGAPKAPLRELARFAALLNAVDLPRCSRPAPAAALLLPALVEGVFPFIHPTDRIAPVEALRQAYVAAAEADLPAGVIRERDGIPDGPALLIAPSTKQLTAPTWRRLVALAEAGTTVYVSYSAGTSDVQRGPWYADLDGTFGVRQRLRYGLADPIEGDTVTFRITEAFGSLHVGEELTFRVGGTPSTRCYLPVDPVEARVVAVDAHGRPALLRREVGAGRIVLCTYPLEQLAAALPAVNPEPTHRIYRTLAEIAGVAPDVTVDDPLVTVGMLHHDDGRRFVVMISGSAVPITVKPRLTGGVLVPLGGGEPIDAVTLDPFDVLVGEWEAAVG